MSRLIVKGLPARFNDSNLRDLFKPLGDVTDARIMKTKDGRSRCFGFVGFRTKQDASKARAAMHKAFVDTRPVTVEVAHAKGAEAIPRPWSQYSTGSSQHYRKNHIPPPPPEDDKQTPKGDTDSEAKNEEKEDATKRKKNNNNKDDNDFEAFEEVASKSGTKGIAKAVDRSKLVESKRIGTKGKVVERKHVTFDDSESDEDDELYQELDRKKTASDAETTEVNTSPEKGNETALNEEVSDMDYFKSKITTSKTPTNDDAADASEDDDDSDDDDDDDVNDDGDDDDVDDDGDDGDDDDDNNDDDDKNNSNKQTEKRDTSGKESSESEITETGEEPSESKSDENGTKEKPCKTVKAVEADNEIDAGETGRLMIRNLAFSVTEEELETVFESFGALSEVHIVRDTKTNKPRGMGFVQFCVPENAAKALVSVDGSFHCGRILHVLPARPKPNQVGNKPNAFGSGINVTTGSSSTYKTERELAQKDAARTGKDDSAQHALHLSANAVAELAADQHGVSKADLLGTKRGESGVAAVRLAIAEASIQGEAKAYLMDNGIDIDVLFKLQDEIKAETVAAKRKRQSRRAFLIKNLPARTPREALWDIFSKYGSITKLIVVPSGLLGVVHYDTASDARRAYNGLAYTKFKDTPLYLEWLPAEAIHNLTPKANEHEGHEPSDKIEASSRMEPAPSNNDKHLKPDDKNAGDKSDSGAADQGNEVTVKKADDEKEEIRGCCSVYVKNLSFDTRDQQLRKHFEGVLRKRPDVLKKLRSAKVALKRGPEGKESQQLSAGFGFLEFESLNDAKEAVKIGQNSSLDGHVLRLQLSVKAINEGSGGDNSNAAKKRKRTSTAVNADGSKVKPGPKLMVRNVAFEATRKEIRQLFETFGQLKTVRMPRKMDGAHRGFAFVEFVSRNEAVNAYDALRDTHLYGRHLVIEYAKDDAIGGAAMNMAELQEKAARDVAERKRRKVFGGGGDNAGGRNDEKDEQSMMRDVMYG